MDLIIYPNHFPFIFITLITIYSTRYNFFFFFAQIVYTISVGMGIIKWTYVTLYDLIIIKPDMLLSFDMVRTVNMFRRLFCTK